MKKYYTLLSRENADDRWVIDFGDYDKSVVEDEKRDRKEGFLPRGTQFKIIATKRRAKRDRREGR